MNQRLALTRDDLMVVLEGATCFILVAAGALAMQFDWMPLGTAVNLSVWFLLGLIFLAWLRFDGGRHPCFLFLGMLLIFQAGRLLGYTFGVLEHPFQIVVQTAYPFDISPESSRITLLLITVSAVCVYLPSRWRFKPLQLDASHAQEWLPTAYFLLMLTFPFLVYKNYLYLSFVRSHGGYLAVFTESDEILKSAGTVVRSLSFVAYNLFLFIFVLERRRRLLIPITIIFFATSAFDLLIGFRGKVFLLILTLWYLNNLKKGAKFRLLPLAISVAVLSLLAVLAAGFRENKEGTLLNPVAFISAQGVSMGVTGAAIEFRNRFKIHAGSYLINSLETAYKPSGQFKEGELFDNDLSIFLNRNAYDLGFGTGSSYLGEAYLAGGILLTIFVSFGIGFSLTFLHRKSSSAAGALVLTLLMPGLIYMPRTGLLEPVAMGVRSLISACVIFGCLWVLRKSKNATAAAIHRMALATAGRNERRS